MRSVILYRVLGEALTGKITRSREESKQASEREMVQAERRASGWRGPEVRDSGDRSLGWGSVAWRPCPVYDHTGW